MNGCKTAIFSRFRVGNRLTRNEQESSVSPLVGSLFCLQIPQKDSAVNTDPSVSAGISRWKRSFGSYTVVPACFSALSKASDVRLRNSPAVLDMLLSKTLWALLCRTP